MTQMVLSVNDIIWQQKEINEELVTELYRSFDINDLVCRILSSKISSAKEALHFLSPKLKNLLPDPYHLLDMDLAIKRMIVAIKQKQKICIFADYDVDGATSSALIKNALRSIPCVIDIYVPDRILEGYGPNKSAIKKIKESGYELLITVDCGAVANDALDYANNLDLDVIVIDHHITSEKLPTAIAVVNPNRIDQVSDYKYIAAVGVCFIFLVGLVSTMKQDHELKCLPLPNLMQYLDLVAIGTVCDVMPIIQLNRAFVTQGLKIIMQRCNIGINSLLDIANIQEKPNIYHLGFVLGPRINAGGRVGRANIGARLLSTTSESEANVLAKELDKYNNERKAIELVMLEKATNIAIKQSNANVLFIVGQGWHPGVIGIVAGRLKDKFNKPTVVIAMNDGIGKASCRSIEGIDLGSKILNAKNNGLIVEGGGHAMAAGFSATEQQLPELQKFLNNSCNFDKPQKIIKTYNAELTTKSVTIELLDELSQLEPYGNGNPSPIFKFSHLFILKANVLQQKHISCILIPSKSMHSNSVALNAIIFNAIDTKVAQVLLSSRSPTISVIGSLSLNTWNNKQNVQIHIKDIILESY